jgi:hypothetical protein
LREFRNLENKGEIVEFEETQDQIRRGNSPLSSAPTL